MFSKNPRVASLFAGIGGIDLAFQNAGCQIVYANEIDPKACETYRYNFKDPSYLHEDDVYHQHLLLDDDIDILVGGFPCQAFSVAGYRKGFTDDRGVLYTQVIRMISECRPKAVFLENVKNLQTHDGGNTYRVIRESLEDEGYKVDQVVLNTKDYGNIPQNRERIYIVAFKKDLDGFCPTMDRFSFPGPVELTDTIGDLVDFHHKVDDSFYYGPDSQYYERLDSAMDDPHTVYQWRRIYVRKNKSNVCPTLTANMGTGGHNVPLIRDDFGIRKLTPEECLRFQGFPDWFGFPDIARSYKYKQVGNSVSVPVVQRIAVNMLEAMYPS